MSPGLDLEPGPILDTHVHLWDPVRFEIPWLAADPVLDQRYDLDRFETAIAGTTVAALVYVQVEVAPPLALLEAEEVARLARRDPRIRAMVPWAPLEFGQRAEPFIERLLSLGPLTRAVRRLIQDEPDPEFCLRPRFVEGIRLLASHDLGFDLCVRGTLSFLLSSSSSTWRRTSGSCSTTRASRTSGVRRSIPGGSRSGTSPAATTSSANSVGWSPRRSTQVGRRTTCGPSWRRCWTPSGRGGRCSVGTGPWSFWPPRIAAGSTPRWSSAASLLFSERPMDLPGDRLVLLSAARSRGLGVRSEEPPSPLHREGGACVANTPCVTERGRSAGAIPAGSRGRHTSTSCSAAIPG